MEKGVDDWCMVYGMASSFPGGEGGGVGTQVFLSGYVPPEDSKVAFLFKKNLP